MRKWLSMLLSTAVIVCAAGTAYADADISVGETAAAVSGDAYRVSEVTELRETNSETYLLSDGTYECIVYAGNKYYQDENEEYIEISNKIVAEEFAGKSKTYGFANEANDVKVYFSEKEASVLIASDGNELSFTLVREEKEDSDKILKEAEDKSKIFEAAGAVKVSIGEKCNDYIFEGFELQGENCITYTNVLNSTDVIYSVGNGFVKEYIILKDNSAPSEFQFIFDTNEYIIKQNNEGIPEFFDTEGNLVFQLGSLFAIDSDGNYTDSVTYNVNDDGNGQAIVAISIDKSYLYDKNRSFPVMIDPCLMLYGAEITYDTYINSQYPNTNYYTKPTVSTGKYSARSTRRTYIRFDLPEYLYNATISSAYFCIRKYSGKTPNVKAYRVKEDWTSPDVTWNNSPCYAGTQNDYSFMLCKYDNNGWYRTNITRLAIKWCNGTYNNYGLLLKDVNESTVGQYTNFYSSDSSSPNRPELRITYELNQAVLIGVTNTGHDHETCLWDSQPYLLNCAFINDVNVQTGAFTVNTVKDYLSDASNNVLITRSHGDKGTNNAGSLTRTYIILNDTYPEVKFKSDSSMEGLDLSNMDLVAFIACNTGYGGINHNNLPTEAVRKGAKTAIGFRREIACTIANDWTVEFCKYMKKGYSVLNACNKLSQKRYYIKGNLNRFVICGDTSTQLNWP